MFKTRTARLLASVAAGGVLAITTATTAPAMQHQSGTAMEHQSASAMQHDATLLAMGSDVAPAMEHQSAPAMEHE